MPKHRAIEARAFKGMVTPLGVPSYGLTETLKALPGGSLKP